MAKHREERLGYPTGMALCQCGSLCFIWRHLAILEREVVCIGWLHVLNILCRTWIAFKTYLYSCAFRTDAWFTEPDGPVRQ